ncbi:hypothetical protein FD755_006704, partial [Muntiacus reevesi]
ILKRCQCLDPSPALSEPQLGVGAVTFSDCRGNDKLHYEVSSPYFKVHSDGRLVALRNITAVGKTLFIHARTPHAEDMAELVIVGGKDIQGSLQTSGTALPACMAVHPCPNDDFSFGLSPSVLYVRHPWHVVLLPSHAPVSIPFYMHLYEDLCPCAHVTLGMPQTALQPS